MIITIACNNINNDNHRLARVNIFWCVLKTGHYLFSKVSRIHRGIRVGTADPEEDQHQGYKVPKGKKHGQIIGRERLLEIGALKILALPSLTPPILAL